ncbi:MAG: ELWxxDGT repeat protein [Salibacteraceae bacterium]
MKQFTLLIAVLLLLPVAHAQHAEILKPIGDPGVGIGIDFQNIIPSNNRFFFRKGVFASSFDQYDWWISDGTEAGTQIVKAFSPTLLSWQLHDPTEVNGTMFFVHNDSTSGIELWKSDGTAAGTVLVKDIDPGFDNIGLSFLTSFNGDLYFFRNAPGDFQLWKSDGTEQGTQLVVDFPTVSQGFLIEPIVVVNNKLFFMGPSNQGIELWASDGTPAGSYVVKDIWPGANGSEVQYLMEHNGLLYFFANDNIHGLELWKSDGTESGTVLVKDAAPGATPFLWFPEKKEIGRFNGELYYARRFQGKRELWKTDGTSAGTVQLKIFEDSGLNNIEFAEWNGSLLFSADDGTHGVELWKTDGTVAGTQLVKDLLPGINGSGLNSFTVVEGELFFTANVNEAGIWKTDGTSAGTQLVSHLPNGLSASAMASLTAFGNTLFFTAEDATNGVQIWKLKDNVVSVAETPVENSISIGPNPSYDVFYLHTQGQELELVVTDLQGRTTDVQIHNYKLDLSNQPTGIYLLRGTVNGQPFRKKLIKL